MLVFHVYTTIHSSRFTDEPTMHLLSAGLTLLPVLARFAAGQGHGGGHEARADPDQGGR